MFWIWCGVGGDYTFLSNKNRIFEGGRLAPLCSDLFKIAVNNQQQGSSRHEILNNIAQRPECTAHTMHLDIIHTAFIMSPIAHLLLFMIMQARQDLRELRNHGPNIARQPRHLQPGIEHLNIAFVILSYSAFILLYMLEEKQAPRVRVVDLGTTKPDVRSS